MTDFKLEPIAGTRNRVFVQLTEAKEKRSAGGIILGMPETPRNEGIIVGVSPQDENGITPSVKIGDHVFFSEHAGVELEYDGVTVLVMKEADLQAKLK